MKMKQQGRTSGTAQKPVTWPQLVIPPSESAIKGLTEEQHAAFNNWYLGLQNMINDHNATVQSTLTTLHDRVSALETPKTVAP